MQTRLLSALLSMCALLTAVTVADAGDAVSNTDKRFLEGLASRQMFDLAEAECELRLADARLTPQARAEWTAQLLAVLREHAKAVSDDAEREALWNKAETVASTFHKTNRDNPRAALVAYGDAMAALARGERARLAAALRADPAAMEKPQELLGRAIAKFKAVDAFLETQLSTTPTADGMSERELLSLQRNTRYQLGRAYRQRALCYTDGSADRIQALNQAIEAVDRVASLTVDNPLMWNARAEYAACRRLQGRLDEAEQLLQRYSLDEMPPDAAQRFLVEYVRLALARGDVDRAIAWTTSLQETPSPSPDADLACAEAYLARWDQAGAANDERASEQWQRRTEAQLALIGRRHGKYWAWRGELLLSKQTPLGPGDENLERRIKVADLAYFAGKLNEALAEYDAARRLALQQGKRERAYTIGMTAVAIENKRGNRDEVLRRLRETTTACRDQKGAAAAHRAAISLAVRQAAAPTADDATIECAIAVLREHIATWPETPETDDVRWQLARLLEANARWGDAIGAYASLGPNFKDASSLVDATARCYVSLFEQLEKSGDKQRVNTQAREAVAWFMRLTPEPGDPEWNDASRKASLAAARILLARVPDGAAEAERTIQRAIAENADASSDWLARANMLRIVALAEQGDLARAQPLLNSTMQGPPDAFLGMLTTIGDLLRDTPTDRAGALASLQGQLAQYGTTRSDLSAAQRRMAERLLAEALAKSGNKADAIAEYRKLVAANPRDRGVYTGLARLLSEQADKPSQAEALTMWRKIDTGSKDGSDEWFEAKYEIARLQHRLGDSDQAKRIITLLRLTHPDLGGPRRKQAFLELLGEIQGHE